MLARRLLICGVILLGALALAPLFSGTAWSVPNPRLDWKTISTEHFDVHFHTGGEWTAQQVAQVAEEIYPYITGVYEYEPRRCHFVILDTEDYANGAAYYYDNKIEIWATNLEFGLRGTTDWIRNVVTHEFTHIVSIQASMKMPLRIPALYFQAVGFETEKRPDVITGYPDMIISYPITGTVVPAWWAEGVAQYQSPGKQYDCWDTHRDMILRAAVTENRMLSYDDMGFLGHKGIGNEQVYDHGYGMVRYIAATYGPESIDKINERLGKLYRLTMDGAIKDVTGKSGREVYGDWVASLRARYDRQLAPITPELRNGTVLNDEGFMTISPSFSPDGSRIVFLSNRGSDYAATSLYITGRDGKKLDQIEGGVSSRAVFSPDGGRLAYAKHERADAYGARLSDVFVYDLATKKETRLTRKARAAEPQWSPDGRHIVCVLNADGSHRMAVMKDDGSDMRVIYGGEGGLQIYAPQYSPDGSRILFGIFTEGTRDIASIAADGSDFRYELRTINDERDARWTADGSGIVFASDRTGIFNIYRMDLTTGEVAQLSNVAGGAFTPDAAATDGAVAYSEYSGKGYHLSLLDAAGAPVAGMAEPVYAERAAGEFEECAGLKGSLSESYLPLADGVEVASNGALPDGAAAAQPGMPLQQAYESTPYKWDYTGFQFFPRFVLWNNKPRAGLFVANNEILERQSLFFGGSYGADGEFDAVIDFELRRLFPVIYMSYYRVRQKYSDEFGIEDLDRYYFIDYRYDVWSGDLGLRFEFEDPYSRTRRNDLKLWWNHSEYTVFLTPEYVPFNDRLVPPTPEQPVGWKYFVGNEAHLNWYYKGIKRAVDSDINPRGGREVTVDAMFANDDLFVSGEFDYGVNPKFTRFQFGQYTVDWKEYLALPGWRHTLQVRLMASIIDKPVDDFFWVYMGGMDRLRGYTYYAIGGRKGAMASVTYRFPIWRQINKQASWLTIKDLYGGVFYEAASVWNNGNLPTDDPDIARDYYSTVGGELRLNLGSFYSYPTTVNVMAAYAMDKAVYVNPIASVAPVYYDPQWRYYVIVGFSF
jgi:Tol biopolymer transport system component